MFTMLQRFLTLILMLGFAGEVFAARVTQVRDKRALIDLAGGLEDAKVGDELIASDMNGKRRAIMKIRQIKGVKALADITKGTAEAGYDLASRKISTANTGSKMSREIRDDDLRAQEASPEADAYYKKLGRRKSSGAGFGFLGNMQQTKMTVDFTAGAGANIRDVTANMTGMSFGVLGYYDYPVFPSLQLRGLAGLEQMTASGSISTSDCSGTTTCDFSVNYLSMYGHAKFNFMDNKSMRLWVAGGAGFLIAMSKSSSVIANDKISTNQVYLVSGGGDIYMGRSNYIPISIEMGMHPASETVQTSTMTIRAGYGWLL